MDELVYLLEQNRQAIELQMKDLSDEVASLQQLVANDDWAGSAARKWTGGSTAQIVGTLAALLARQKALAEVLEMIQRKQQ